MRSVFPLLILVAGAWVALTFVHPTLARGTYEVMMSKGGIRIFAICLAATLLLTLLRRRK